MNVYEFLKDSEVLKNIDQIAVFKKLVNFNRINDKLVNPFRRDIHPTCTVSVFNHMLLFNDWAYGKRYNAIDLAIEYLASMGKPHTRGDAIRWLVNNHYGGIKIDSKAKEVEVNTISIIEDAFDDYKYYIKKYKLSKDTIRGLYRTLPIKYITVNNIQIKKTVGPMYALFTGNDSVKVYKPLEVRENKFRSFLTSNAIYGNTVLDLFKGNILFITASHKDAMCIFEAGFLAIAPAHSETQVITYDLMKILQARFKYIIVLFDNDLPGRKNSAAYKNIYPDLHVASWGSIKTEYAKDVADLRERSVKKQKKFLRKIVTKVVMDELQSSCDIPESGHTEAIMESEDN